MSVWFKSRLNPWYIWIPSNPNLYSTKIIMKMRWQTIASNVSIRTISPTATPLPKAYDCVAVYIAGRRTSLVVYGWWPQPPTKKDICDNESMVPRCRTSISIQLCLIYLYLDGIGVLLGGIHCHNKRPGVVIMARATAWHLLCSVN